MTLLNTLLQVHHQFSVKADDGRRVLNSFLTFNTKWDKFNTDSKVGELVESNKDDGRRVVTTMMGIEDKAGLWLWNFSLHCLRKKIKRTDEEWCVTNLILVSTTLLLLHLRSAISSLLWILLSSLELPSEMDNKHKPYLQCLKVHEDISYWKFWLIDN